MTAALGVVEAERAARGWEGLWARDRWRQHELPHGDLAIPYDNREVVLRFDGFAQPWLKEAVKRWTRARLLASLSPRSMARYELVVFSRWLAELAPEVSAPSAMTRGLLEDYMLWVGTQRWSQSTRRRRLGTLRAAEQREDGLVGLPRSADI